MEKNQVIDKEDKLRDKLEGNSKNKKANVIVTLIKLNFKLNIIETISLQYMNKSQKLKILFGNKIKLKRAKYNINYNYKDYYKISYEFTNNILNIIKENKKLSNKYIIINKNNINEININKCSKEGNENESDDIKNIKYKKSKYTKEAIFSNFLSYLLILQGVEFKLNICNMKININSIIFLTWESYIINDEEIKIIDLIKQSNEFIEYIYDTLLYNNEINYNLIKSLL